MVAPGVKREAVAHVVAVHGVSQRRACKALAVDRSSVRYRSVRPDDAEARAAMKAVAAERRRFGYRRIHVMLERQGIVMNLKKLRRLYREERLQVRRRGGRKRALGTRRPMLVPDAPNQRWSLDFVSDALTDEPLVISSLAASCCCCAENPLIPAVQISAATSLGCPRPRRGQGCRASARRETLAGDL